MAKWKEHWSIGTKDDMVDRPPHYSKGLIECIEYIKDLLTYEEFIGYLRANIVKYIHRWRDKNGLEDLHKARYFLNYLIKEVEENDGKE